MNTGLIEYGCRRPAANLKELSKGAGRYILATPVGKVKEIKDEVLSHPGRYADIAPNLRAKEVVIGDGERPRTRRIGKSGDALKS